MNVNASVRPPGTFFTVYLPFYRPTTKELQRLVNLDWLGPGLMVY